jgi:hypothetical protein
MAFDSFLCGTAADFPVILSTDDVCESSIDQTQKIAFSLSSIPGFTVDVSETTDIDKSASWVAKVTAGLRFTPYITGFAITPGDYQEEANENNINGIPQHLGTSFSVATGMIKNANPLLISKLEALTTLSGKYAGITQIKGYLLGRNGRITGTTSGNGIPVYNVAFKDVSAQGRNQPDTWEFRFYLPEDWSKSKKTFVAAGFDPVALTNPAS